MIQKLLLSIQIIWIQKYVYKNIKEYNEDKEHKI